ncbi:hypothetical protein LTR17_027804 [Elasticomyces elasticus]|nr:hypothetical protein LTR17_027804 [Elasticomyces elasticus]
MTGVNLVTYYAGSIFQNSLNLSPFTSRLLAGVLGTAYFIFALFSPWAVERFGRRQILIGGSILETIAMASLVGLTGVQGKGVGIAATAMFFVFNAGFAYGWTGTPWLYPAEISPLAIRAPANATTTTANWIFNFVVVMITPPAFNGIGNYTYLIFAIFNALAIPMVYFFYPESKGRSLEEMDEIFQSVKGLRGVTDAVKVSLTKPMRYGKKGELLSIPVTTARGLGVLDNEKNVGFLPQSLTVESDKIPDNDAQRVENANRK